MGKIMFYTRTKTYEITNCDRRVVSSDLPMLCVTCRLREPNKKCDFNQIDFNVVTPVLRGHFWDK